MVKKALIERTFRGTPPLLVFTKDRRQLIRGDFRRGADLTILYDAERLTGERSADEHGKPAWSIYSFVKFSESGEVHRLELWSETGVIRAKAGNDVGEGTMMKGTIVVPADAEEVIVWFLNTGRSGREYWDSNYGANYHFRFVGEDIKVEHAAVVSSPQQPTDRFEVMISAAPDVEGVGVKYSVVNTAPAPPLESQAELVPSRAGGAGGRRTWSNDDVAVPHGAVVYFTVAYRARGRTYTDDNNRKGYLVS